MKIYPPDLNAHAFRLLGFIIVLLYVEPILKLLIRVMRG